MNSLEGGANRRLLRLALLPLGVVVGLLAAWAVTAPPSDAIVATARLKMEFNHKTVQHKEGGIVRRILVRDGDLVRSGQPLIVVGDVQNDAEVSQLLDQLESERIRNARAATEATLTPTFVPPAGPARSPAARDHLAREAALFAARRRTLDEQVASLTTQVRDGRAQAAALAPQGVGELRTRIAQARNQYQQVAADEAKESAGRIRELEERLRPFLDQADRQYVRAPADGRVMGLRVTSAGEVIRQGDPLLDIVPTQEKLLVEARIRSQDIAHVYEGAPAEVRLSAFDARATPLLPGKVALVSADRVSSLEGDASWYVANVEIDAAALARHPEIRLRAGMPAEVIVATPRPTLLQYLAKPLTATLPQGLP